MRRKLSRLLFRLRQTWGVDLHWIVGLRPALRWWRQVGWRRSTHFYFSKREVLMYFMPFWLHIHPRCDDA